jgi:FO synthase
MSLQAPPNLRPGDLAPLLRAGERLGGVSPDSDHVNRRPLAQLALLASRRAADRELVERLALAPRYARAPARWVDPALVPRVLRMTDVAGRARSDGWFAGSATVITAQSTPWLRARASVPGVSKAVGSILAIARVGGALDESAITTCSPWTTAICARSWQPPIGCAPARSATP